MATWLVSGGETGELIRAFDWSSTRIGPLETWPQSLRTAVNFMLEARHPVYIGWGAECISLYNDGYIPVLANKHPNALGKPYAALWPEFWEEYRPHIEAVMGGKAQYWVDQPAKFVGRPNLPVSWFTFSWTPLRNEQGLVAGFLCVANETTERILGERQLVESMDEGYCVIEVLFDDNTHPIDYRFLRSNPAFEEQTGLKNAKGRTVRELVPDFEQQWIDIYGKVAVTGQAIRLINEAPSMGRWYDAYAFRIVGQSNQVGVLFRDITERKEFEQRLQEADRHKDEFLAMLSHELRNPLAALTSAAQVLRMAAPGAQTFVGAQGIIERQTQHMSRLIEELLDINLVRLGKLSLKFEALNLAEVVAEVTDTKRAAHAFDGRPVVNLAVSRVWVQGDRARLEQIYSNLLDNALKFTPPSGAIYVDVKRDGKEAVLTIADNGRGIDATTLPKVFDLFVQAEQGRERVHGGLGLGLALVQRLAHLHGGHVEAASDGIGCGARLMVVLPAVDESS